MKVKNLVIVIICLTTFASCASLTTVEDVKAKIEKAEKANSKALTLTKEAIVAREKLTADYKKSESKKLDKKIGAIDKQTKSITKSSKGGSNKTVTNSLETAVLALDAERKQLVEQKERIINIKQQNWKTYIYETDSLMKQVNMNLTEIDESINLLKAK